MRILHITEAFATGVLEVVRHLAAYGANTGHAVAIAYGRRAETPANVESLIDSRVELFAMPWTQRTARAQMMTARELRRLVRQWQPDLVHAHSSFAGVLTCVSVPPRIPVIFSPHAFASSMHGLSQTKRLAYVGVERLITARATTVGAVSHSEATYASTQLGVRRVIVVPNGIAELDESAPSRSSRPKRPRICGVGRIGPQRRPREVAEILGALAERADVIWLGDEDRPGAGADVLRAAGVRVTGWLGRDDLLRELRLASVYLHWTAWDGQPISILEALAVGVPVVASDIPPSREILGDAQVRSSPDAAVELITRLLDDDAEWTRTLERQAAVRQRYSARRMAVEWHEAYDTLANTPRAR